jgi:hypothetical protein
MSQHEADQVVHYACVKSEDFIKFGGRPDPPDKTPQVIEMSNKNRPSSIIFTLATALAASGFTGCSIKNTPAAESPPRAEEARWPSATDQPPDELAVLDTLKGAYSGRLTDPQQKELLEAACQAIDIWDLSQVSSSDDATKWVARKSNVPAEKVRGLLSQLADLQNHPRYTRRGLLTVNAVCTVP